jgi:hypothetical protein
VPYDIAMSEHGDLVVSGSRDLAGISGTDLIEQRIRTRLRIRRGSWVYDTEGDLGSNLERVINQEPTQAERSIQNYVREALEPMEEISVVGVTTDYTDLSLTLSVQYQLLDIEGEAEGEIQDFQITLQSAAEAGG